ncbi:MAG: alpha-amylase family glycosyl hydrolase [Acholeplasmataceae bacterium]|jgi:glycosidase|nr:alpha-amylase family glycosyl hydrolase [Acholeplasmataceae bacterium]
MARKTDINLRTMTIYQIFPRQYSPTHDFSGIIDDLDRIRNMGIDIIYLLPIHTIGMKDRKGSVGSPYAIEDYYAIHADLGNFEDFKNLVDEVHKRHMKIMIDIVFNHTSRDSKLVKTHPEWFYKNELGDFANRVGDWSDITDLDFREKKVWYYLIDVLKYWAQYVDGFRCDVAPLLPLDFWMEARQEVEKINPDITWLTESVHPGFVKYLRDLGYDCSSDSEMFQVFDICYDYDIFDHMLEYLKHAEHLSVWMNEIERQEMCYPKNYVKLRSFENHDQPRLRSLVRDESHFIQLIALNFFLRGIPMIYAGQEHQITHRPDLFEYDELSWQHDQSIELFIQRLSRFKKQPAFAEGIFNIHHRNHVVVMSYTYHNQFIVGIFNLENEKEIVVPLMDGNYVNYIDDAEIKVLHNKIVIDHQPIIIDTTKEHRK